MTVDHIGWLLFPDLVWLRFIGRISFPLFAFLIAFGCTKTRNIGRYFLRLISFACWIQVLFVLLKIDTANIFFTLALAVLAIAALRATKKKMKIGDAFDAICVYTFLILLSALFSYFADFLNMDYGAQGIALIIGFFVILQIPQKFRAPLYIAALVAFNLTFGFNYQWLSMFALCFILSFSDRTIKNAPPPWYVFYLYYPFHIAVLWLINLI